MPYIGKENKTCLNSLYLNRRTAIYIPAQTSSKVLVLNHLHL